MGLDGNGQRRIKNVIVLGFALFAMFFGAGNLIFPPYLGLESGESWFIGFVCFILVDAGLAVVALMTVARRGDDGVFGITNVMGKGLSKLLMAACALCLGPLVAIPRTAATTFELAVAPLIPGCTSWICGAVFFALVYIACVKPGKVVDIVGKVLAPIMIVALAALIVKGIVSPIGHIEAGSGAAQAVKSGVSSGYQTMDMLGALLLSVVVMTDVSRQGHTDERSRSLAVLKSGLLAAFGLMLVYGGLAFTGALSGGTLSTALGQSGLLLAITTGLWGNWGIALLGVIVAAACFTTAIGLVASCAECFARLLDGKVSYKLIAALICAVSFVISNVGLSSIISIASPVLDLLYPVLIVLVVLTFFSRRIRGMGVYRGAAAAAFITALFTILDGIPGVELYTSALPLASLGLGWVLPAVIGALVGALIKPGVRARGYVPAKAHR